MSEIQRICEGVDWDFANMPITEGCVDVEVPARGDAHLIVTETHENGIQDRYVIYNDRSRYYYWDPYPGWELTLYHTRSYPDGSLTYTSSGLEWGNLGLILQDICGQISCRSDDESRIDYGCSILIRDDTLVGYQECLDRLQFNSEGDLILPEDALKFFDTEGNLIRFILPAD